MLFLGDFNVVLNAGERSGSFRCDLSMREFSDWIEELALIDIPLQGVKFTWRRNESKSRLDRGLCCQSWLSKFPNLSLLGLERSFSDHNPILLSLESESNWGPKPFRCYDAWFMNPKFKQFLISEWQNIPNAPLQHKLKFLKAPMKTWRKENFDSMDNKITNLESVIHELERASEIRTLNGMEIARLNAASTLLNQRLLRRERLWRQRARTYGFKMKDHNTKFFHAAATFKKKKKEILTTTINGTAFQGVSELKYEVRKYFEQRFKQEPVPQFDFNLDNHPKNFSSTSRILGNNPNS